MAVSAKRGDRCGTFLKRKARPFHVCVEALERRDLFAFSVSFQPPVATGLTTTGFAAVSIAVGDVNSDKVADVLPVRLNQTIQDFYGTATGALTLGPILNSGGRVIALADFNKDGKLDLATAGGVLLGKGDGTFTAAQKNFTLPQNTVSIFTGDFNGDGKLDLACVTFAQPTAQGQQPAIGLSVLLGNGDGTLSTAVQTTAVASGSTLTSTMASFQAGDFNGDGKVDVISPFGVQLSKGDGTFGAPIPLFKSSGTSPVIPGSAMAVADFDGDGKLDVAVVPPSTSSSSSTSPPAQVQMLLGHGDGTFSDGGLVSLGMTGNVISLATDDLNSDGAADLIAGVSSAGTPPAGNNTIVALAGNGDATFTSGVAVQVGGAPIQLLTGDFNGDSKPDIISLDAASSSTTVTTGQLFGVAAAVLINTSQGPQTPTVTIQVPRGPVATTDAVPLTANIGVQPGSPAPNGIVGFYDGQTLLGTAPVIRGVATFTAKNLPVGLRSLAASYGGDANYSPTVSSAVPLRVLVTTARVPVLVPSVGTITLPPLFIPGDKGTVAVTVTDAGGGPAHGKVNLSVFLSRTGQLDSSAILVAAQRNRQVDLGTAQGVTFNPAIKAGIYPPGQYTVLAQLAPAARFTPEQVPPTAAASSTQVQAAGNVFGTIGNHSKFTFTAIDASGNQAVLSMGGPGTGTVTVRNGQINVTVTGATSASTLRIVTQGATPFAFGAILVQGTIGTFDGSAASLTGRINITGSATRFLLRSGGTNAITPAAAPRAPGGVGGPPGQNGGPPGSGGSGGTIPSVPSTSITIGAGGHVSFSLGDMFGLSIQSASPLGTVSAGSYNGGQIIAPSIYALNVTGMMSGNLIVHAAGKVQSVRVGTLTGDWEVAGAIQSLRVNGDLESANIFVGADAGADNQIGTADDAFAAGASIGSIFVGGSVLSSVVAASIAPAVPGSLSSGLVLLPKGRLGSITVKGSVSSDSQFLAASVPASVKH